MERFQIGIARPTGSGRRARGIEDAMGRRGAADAGFETAIIGAVATPTGACGIGRQIPADFTVEADERRAATTAGGRRSVAAPVARLLHATGLAARPTTRGFADAPSIG